jgi:hypothetical protein
MEKQQYRFHLRYTVGEQLCVSTFDFMCDKEQAAELTLAIYNSMPSCTNVAREVMTPEGFALEGLVNRGSL